MILLLRAWGPALAWAALIFVLSSRPTLPADLDMGLDKVAHFLAYAVLGFALGRGQTHSRWPWPSALLLGLLYALSDEFHQSLVPGRSPDVADWVADALGTLVGLVLFHRWRRWRRARLDGPAGAAADASPT